MLTSGDLARAYLHRGWRVVPIPPRQKAPQFPDWPSARFHESEIPKLFGLAGNIGVLLGEASGLTDVDLDAREAIAFADRFLPTGAAVFGRTSKPCSHRIYRVRGPSWPFRCVDPATGEMIVELRGDKQQTIFPGSVHPSGERVEWAEEKDPASVSYESLLAAVKKLAVRVLAARYGNGPATDDPATWLPVLAGAPEKVKEAAHAWLGVERIRPQSNSRAANAPDRGRTYAQAVLRGECEAVALTGKGSRNNRLNEAALKTGHYVAGGNLGESETKEALKVAARQCGLPPHEAKATINSGLAKGKQEPRCAPETGGNEHNKRTGGNGQEANKDTAFIRGDGGIILKNRPANIRHAIALLGASLRLNQFSAETEIEGLDGFGPTLTDAGAVRLRLKIEEEFGFLPSKPLFEDVVADLAHASRFHPVRDWLATLKWDCEPRIGNWLSVYAGAEDTPLNRAIGRIFLVAAVRRVRRPGVKFDTMPVFESQQGLDKSTALRTLAIRDEWFTDNLPLNADSKEIIEQTRGVWIAEFAELSGIGKRDIDHVKNFLSRQDDRARPAYGRRSERVPRQYVAAGTTNEDVYLLDTENRRFWPVAVKTFDIQALQKDASQLWAEAACLEAQGEPITLQQDLWADAAEEQAARAVENPYLSTLTGRFGDCPVWVRSETVWEALGIPHERRKFSAREVGHAMRGLGFHRRQIRGRGDKRGERGDYYYERDEEPQ